MSRNGSGTYSVPNTFVPGTTITAADHNENWSDLAAEMTNSLALDGQSNMTGQLKSAVGSQALPGMAFSGDTSSGFYRPGGSNVCLSLGGTKAMDASLLNGFQILGSPAGDSASAGFVGEYLSSSLQRASAQLISTGTAASPVSVTLTAGDWDVGGVLGFLGDSTTKVSHLSASIGTTSNTRNATVGFESALSYGTAGQNVFETFDILLPLPTVRFTTSSSTPIYATGLASFTVATARTYGFFWARRAR